MPVSSSCAAACAESDHDDVLLHRTLSGFRVHLKDATTFILHEDVIQRSVCLSTMYENSEEGSTVQLNLAPIAFHAWHDHTTQERLQTFEVRETCHVSIRALLRAVQVCRPIARGLLRMIYQSIICIPMPSARCGPNTISSMPLHNIYLVLAGVGDTKGYALRTPIHACGHTHHRLN